MSFELILVASLVLVFNVLDSVSTRLCLSLSQKDVGRESNPIMASLMQGDYLIAELVKHLGAGLLVIWWSITKDIETLLTVLVLLGLVVLNNGYIFITRKIIKKNLPTFFSALRKASLKILKLSAIPDWVEFLVTISILFGVAKWVASIILGGIE